MNKFYIRTENTEVRHIQVAEGEAKYWQQRATEIGVAQGFNWRVGLPLAIYNKPSTVKQFSEVGLKC
jgi:hypothetical protein